MAHLGPHPTADSNLHWSPGCPSSQGMRHANPSQGVQKDIHRRRAWLLIQNALSARAQCVWRTVLRAQGPEEMVGVCFFCTCSAHTAYTHTTPYTQHAQHTNAQPYICATQHTQDIPTTHIYSCNTTQHSLYNTIYTLLSMHPTQHTHGMHNTPHNIYLYMYNTIYTTQHIHTTHKHKHIYAQHDLHTVHMTHIYNI